MGPPCVAANGPAPAIGAAGPRGVYIWSDRAVSKFGHRGPPRPPPAALGLAEVSPRAHSAPARLTRQFLVDSVVTALPAAALPGDRQGAGSGIRLGERPSAW